MAGRSALTREEIATLRTIGEVAAHLDLPQHVLRFWETRFKEIDPVKRAGGRRFYRPRDIELVEAIRHLLYREGYTIKGVQRILAEQGVDGVIEGARRRQMDKEPFSSTSPSQPAEPAPAREPPQMDPAPSPVAREAAHDLPEPPEPAPVAPAPATFAVEARSREPKAEILDPLPSVPALATPQPVFHAPVVVTRRDDHDQAKILRKALAEIQECKRLLELTRR